ncbi:MAG: sigma-70 family RNA polymerase sigma factor [Oscillospiraceae bacterium]|nr:sigma-70 family RNA polymerase sigma factor [Oscillospiraceae bacterium]
MEDSEIIALFYERSEQAIEETRCKYGTVVRRTAFHILNSFQDTEECENDTYLAAWNRIPPESPYPYPAYLCRIARNLALNRYHFNTASRRNSSYDLSLDELDEVAGIGNDPASDYEVKQLTFAIEAFLDTLSAEDRRMFVLRYWFACPVKEIADELNTSPHRISVRLSRTRSRLQKFLKKEGLIS